MPIGGGSGNTAGAVVRAYVLWGVWAITLRLQGYDLPEAVAARIPDQRDFVAGMLIVVALLVAPRGLVPERARVSRWLDRRAATLRHAEEAHEGSRTG